MDTPRRLIELAARAACRALPWCVLLVVMSTITYGLNLLATALAPTASAVSMTRTTIDHVQDNAALLDDAVLELRSSTAAGAAQRSP